MKRWALLLFTNTNYAEPKCYHEMFFDTEEQLHAQLEKLKANLTRSTSWGIYEFKDGGLAADLPIYNPKQLCEV